MISDGMMRILSNVLITSRPGFPRSILPTTISSISCLSLSVRVEKLNELQTKAKLEKTSLNSLVPTLVEVSVGNVGS
jgi:hypothetical protein